MAQNKAAVFILLGQSNAVGHGVPMEPRDVIREPMKNVFGLSREENQSFENRALVWSGYTSFGMNLAETQDNTYSVANCLAALWQDHIDSGNAFGLPDLYIVQIAIGAQGVTRQYMWHPDRAEKLIPGKLGTVDISLYLYCMHHFSLLEDSFRALGFGKVGDELFAIDETNNTLVSMRGSMGTQEDDFTWLAEFGSSSPRRYSLLKNRSISIYMPPSCRQPWNSPVSVLMRPSSNSSQP